MKMPSSQPWLMNIKVEIWKCYADGRPWKRGPFLKRPGVVQAWSNETLRQFVQRLSSHATAPPGMRIEGPVISFKVDPNDANDHVLSDQMLGQYLNPNNPVLILKFDAGRPSNGLGGFFGGSLLW